MVTKLPQFSPTGGYFPQAATVDVVNFEGEATFSRKVFHAPQTFKADWILKTLTGYNRESFNNNKYPKIE